MLKVEKINVDKNVKNIGQKIRKVFYYIWVAPDDFSFSLTKKICRVASIMKNPFFKSLVIIFDLFHRVAKVSKNSGYTTYTNRHIF